MPVPDITLAANTVLLTQVSSGLGISQENNQYINGNVEMVNDLEDEYAVDDLVLFNPTNATRFQVDNVTYFVVTTDKIFYKENYIPPA